MRLDWEMLMWWRSELAYVTMCIATLGPCVHVCKLYMLYNINATACWSVNYAQSWGVRVCPGGTRTGILEC